MPDDAIASQLRILHKRINSLPHPPIVHPAITETTETTLAGASVLMVASLAGFLPNQPIAYEVAGGWEYNIVLSASNGSLSLANPLVSDVNSGSPVGIVSFPEYAAKVDQAFRQADYSGTAIEIDQYDEDVYIGTTGLPKTVTLPLASDVPVGKRIVIIDGAGDAALNAITLTASVGDTVYGSPLIVTNYGIKVCINRGSGQWILS